MSHRNSLLKPSARERTKRRWRERHEISTPADKKHFSLLQEVKNEMRFWMSKARRKNANLKKDERESAIIGDPKIH